MIRLGDKEIDALYYVDEEGVEKEVEAIYLGEEKVWPEEEDNNPIIDISGDLLDESIVVQVVVNGQKYIPNIVGNHFSFMLKGIQWEYGVSRSSTSCWFYEDGGIYHVLTIEGKVIGLLSAKRLFRGMTYLKKVNLTKWDFSLVTDMEQMFLNDANLENIIGFEDKDTSLLESLVSTFSKCSALKELDLSNWNVSNVSSLNTTFNECTSLKKIVLSNWNFGENVTFTNTFYNATNLVDIIGPIFNINNDLDIHYSPLSIESALVLINGLKDGGRKKLTLKSSTYSNLTPEQLAIGTSKGWTIASA